MKKAVAFAFIVSLTATSLFAAEDCSSADSTTPVSCIAHLSNGFDVPFERQEIEGENIKLYMKDGGYLVVQRASIATVEGEPLTVPEPKFAKTATINDHVSSASSVTGIDPDFLKSVIQSESGGKIRAVSPKGAQGLMQLMPATASKLGVKDAFDPEANVRGGSQYLKELLEKYNGDAAKALAAYNAGPHRVEQYHGIPPYAETQQYVAKVIRDYNRRKLSQTKVTPRKTKARPVTTAQLQAKQ